MCGLTKLECQVCHTQEPYVFHACKRFIRKRFHCAHIRWPLDPFIHKTFDLCDKCFSAGQKYFNASSEMESSIKKRKRDFNTAMGIPTPSPVGDDGDNDDTNDNERLPHAFHGLGVGVKKHLIYKYKNDSVIDSLQMQSIGGCICRFLTLWLPQCPLCEMPTVTEDCEGIADLEFEPDGAFWTWLRNRKDQDTPLMVQTSIATGFLQKVCDACVLRESKTRGLVSRFLERSSSSWGHKWLIFTWLQSRGLDRVPLHEHSTLDVGLPDYEPPSTKEIMKLMTMSWMRATRGLAFGDAATGETSRAPLIRHPYLFISFDQWQNLCDPLADGKRPALKFHLSIKEDSGLLAKSDLAQAVAELLEHEQEDKRKRREQDEEGHKSDESSDPESEEHEGFDKVDPTAIGPFAETKLYTVLKSDLSYAMTEKKIWTLVDTGAIDAFVALRLKLALRLWYLDQVTRVQNQEPVELIPHEKEVLRDAHEVLDSIIRYVDEVNRQAALFPPEHPNTLDGWAERHAYLQPTGTRDVISKPKMTETMKTLERYLKATGDTVKGFTNTPLESMPLEAVRGARKPYRVLKINPSRPVFICSSHDEVGHRGEKDAARHVQWLRPGKTDSRQTLNIIAMQFTCIAMPTSYWTKMVRIGTIEEALLDQPLPAPDPTEMQRREKQAQKYNNIASALM